MRNLRLLALVAPAFLLPLACEDAGSSSGASFNPEAGPGFEAGPLPEAGPIPDAAIDSFVPPPAPKGVTVTVLDGAAGKKDVRVILHDATGAVSGEKLTDAAGKTTIATAPSSITVLASKSSSTPTPVTFFAVADGDNLIVTLPSNVFDETIIGQYSVTFTQGGVLTGATSASVTAGGGCSGGTVDPTAAVVVGLLKNCVGPKNALVASASSNATLLGFGFARDIATPAPGATTNVGPLTFVAPGQTKLTASPNGINAFAELYAVASGALFPANDAGGPLSDGGRNYVTATGFAEAYQSVVRASSQGAFNSEAAFIRREATTAPASLTLPDFNFANALPYITNVTTAAPTAGRPDVTLTSAAPLGASDGGAVVLSWVTAGDTTATWTFVLPPTAAASFKAPALPADATLFVPLATVAVDHVVFFEATQLPSYTDTKKLPITPGIGIELVEAWRPLPTNGTVRLTSWRQPAL